MTIQSDALTIQAEALEILLSEDVGSARAREATTFAAAAGERSENIVLFGAGHLGRRTLSDLRNEGLEPCGIADNNPSLWGRDLEGIPIMSPHDAARSFGRSSVFVVTIWTAGSPHRLRNTVDQLVALGCDRVVPFAWLAWQHSGRMLPHYSIDLPSHLLDQAASVRSAFGLLSDAESCSEYVEQVRWRLTGDPGCLRSPVRGAQYLVDDVAVVRPDEIFLDCGAYDGDTLRDWLSARGPSFRRYVALEPDTANRTRLKDFVASLPGDIADRVEVLPFAVGAESGRFAFGELGSASSSMDIEGLADESPTDGDRTWVDCVRIDDLVDSLGQPSPDFVKMDIEGAEPEALRGGSSFIKDRRPLLALCVYHRQNHLWELPLQVARVEPDYSFYLRPHNEEGWDLVCYSVPPDRRLS